jgi:RNA polymerase sigma factor (sigma-70 family)
MFKFSESSDFLQRFKAGERPFLEKVYFAYVDEVEAYVRRFLAAYGWRSAAARPDVGDLVQEAFVRAFGEKARHAFDGQRDYGPFLGALTRNLMIDWARRSGRELPTEDLDRFPESPPPSEREWSDPDTMAEVNAYLGELPPELREVHEFRYVQCRSQDDACSALAISRQTLRTREKHLREGLRRRLQRLKIQRR